MGVSRVAALNSGDQISIGKYHIRVHISDSNLSDEKSRTASVDEIVGIDNNSDFLSSLPVYTAKRQNRKIPLHEIDVIKALDQEIIGDEVDPIIALDGGYPSKEKQPASFTADQGLVEIEDASGSILMTESGTVADLTGTTGEVFSHSNSFTLENNTPIEEASIDLTHLLWAIGLDTNIHSRDESIHLQNQIGDALHCTLSNIVRLLEQDSFGTQKQRMINSGSPFGHELPIARVTELVFLEAQRNQRTAKYYIDEFFQSLMTEQRDEIGSEFTPTQDNHLQLALENGLIQLNEENIYTTYQTLFENESPEDNNNQFENLSAAEKLEIVLNRLKKTEHEINE